MRFFVVTLACLLAACAAAPVKKGDKQRRAEADELFAGTEGCFLLYDLRAKNFDTIYNKKYCYERTAPASTFKVALAVMAADAGLIKNAETKFPWDRKDRFREAWNRDQTAASWMKESVVWVSQELTRKLGKKKIQAYLRKFSYGNRDFSGDLDGAWLTASLADLNRRSTLKITAFEQVDFLEALYKDDLSVKPAATELARELIDLDEANHGYRLSGKTGSGFAGPGFRRRLGWFVAHVEGNGKEYIAVTRFQDEEPAEKGAAPGGQRAREITESLLRSAGLW